MSGTTGLEQNFALSNLLAPASGVTHCAKFTITLAGNPVVINLPGLSQQLGDFRPQAMIVDNSQNEFPVTINETSYGWTQIVPAGTNITFQYPGVTNQIFNIGATGNGVVQIGLLDYPAFPQSVQNAATAAGGVVQIGDQPIAVTIAAGAPPAPVTYVVGDATVIAAGPSSTVVFAAGEIITGAVITNPTNATENLYVNPVAAATTTESAGNFALAPGQSFSFGPAVGAISANAVTAGHVFSAVRW